MSKGCNCGAEWGGLKAAHCSACHSTFSTPANFDRHRKSGVCRPPDTAGLIQDAKGVWKMPPNAKIRSYSGAR